MRIWNTALEEKIKSLTEDMEKEKAKEAAQSEKDRQYEVRIYGNEPESYFCRREYQTY